MLVWMGLSEGCQYSRIISENGFKAPYSYRSSRVHPIGKVSQSLFTYYLATDDDLAREVFLSTTEHPAYPVSVPYHEAYRQDKEYISKDKSVVWIHKKQVRDKQH